MFADERRKLIWNYIDEHELASTQELSDLTKSSIATVRRDINTMSRDGLIIKTHGGARKVQESAIGNIINRYDVPDPCAREKDEIAKTAANMIEPGDNIFLGSGKTCTALAKQLKSKMNITIVTTNINAVIEFAGSPGISLLLLGGDVKYGLNYIETLGEYTLELLSRMYFDKVFFTINGADIEAGYSIVSRAHAPLYDHLIKNCASCYLLADYSKFGKRTFTQLCSLTRIPNVITDSKINPEYLNYYGSHGIHVFID